VRFLILFCCSIASADPALDRIVARLPAIARLYAPVHERGLLPQSLIRQVQISLGVPVKAGAEGTCQKGGTAAPRIVLKQDSWSQRLDEWEQEELVLHEYGHCILNREHDARQLVVMGERMHRSIMHPNMMGPGAYVLHREYYLRELFSKLTKTPELDVRKPVYEWIWIQTEVEDE
jgi:hypothetical protein